MTTQLMLFDYSQLDTLTSDFVRQRTNELKTLVKRSAQDIIEIGAKLIEVKERLPHGQFGGWLNVEFGWSQQTAKRFINVAQRFQNQQIVDLDFAPSALYLLSAPSTPDDARQEAIERAENGETINHILAKEIVLEHKTKELVYDGSKGINQCQACLQLYDSDKFLSCPYCYKNTNGLNGWVEGLPGMVNGNRPMKPKANQAGDIYTPKGYDACQTPPEALNPLIPYLNEDWIIWEPANGEGLLSGELWRMGFPEIVSTDIITGQNFFDTNPPRWDCLVTNPPYSIKYDWLERCYKLSKPFALLMPVEMLGAKTAQAMFIKYGLEIILLDRRINFKMPNRGWEGSGAQFPVAWFTWGLQIGQQITFKKVDDNGKVS